MLYTDGVTDARGRAGRFGDERLTEALAGAQTADEAVERIHAALRAFAGGEHDDDTPCSRTQKL